MLSVLISRVITLGLGTLYPAYASYKAVRTKNVKEYVKWMMYWIVFALFTSLEVFTDLFLAFWFPFYYEIKIILFIWLLSPTTNGSSILYRKFVHPYLVRREEKIDQMMSAAQTQSYNTVLELGKKGVHHLTNLVMEGVMRAPSVVADVVNAGASVRDITRGNMSDIRLAPPVRQIIMEDVADGRQITRGDIELSEDEMMEQERAVQQFDLVAEDIDNLSDVRFEELETSVAPTSKATKRRNKKKVVADLSLFSGGEDDSDFEPLVASTTTKRKTKNTDGGENKQTRKSNRKPK